MTEGEASNQHFMAFAASVRPVFYQTAMEEFQYATHGGTLFIVQYKDKVFGITCRHVFQDFSPGDLFVGSERIIKKGSAPAQVDRVACPKNPGGEAIGSDVLDLAILCFEEQVTPEFFGQAQYLIHNGTVAQSSKGHLLKVAGVLKEHTKIQPPDIEVGYCDLDFWDTGELAADPVLRTAKGKWRENDITDVTGLSGSPVFDRNNNALCGMVVRGGLKDGECTIYYLDIFDIMQFLGTVVDGTSGVTYQKIPEFTWITEIMRIFGLR